MPSHPTTEELAAFAGGLLDEPSIARTEGHVAGCPVCRAALKALPPDRLTALLRGPPRGEPAAGEVVGDLPPGLSDHPRYRVLGKLGEGGMGVVFKAEHRLLKRVVALKVIGSRLATSPAAVARFRREVEALARLAHPHVAAALDADEAGGQLVLVEEYVAGADLAQVVRERGPVPTAQACAWVRQAALALRHAHERGLVHRDIKPGNLMLTPEGEIKVLDFGLASLHGEVEAAPVPGAPPALPSRSLTDFGQGVGTAGFAAPEQVQDSHTADARSDVYALGMTLVHLLTGRPPVRGGDGERAPDTTLPRPLAAVVGRMTAVDPGRRFATMAEVADALTPLAGGKPGRWSRRGVLVAAGLTLVGGAAAVPTVRRAATGGGPTGRCLWFRRPTDTLHVHGGTVVSTAATYEARVLFPANGGSYGAVFNEWVYDRVDQYLGAGPDKVDAALFPFGWTGHTRPLARDVWHHVGWVFDGAELRLYLDGVRVAVMPPRRDRGDRIGSGATVASVGAVWRPPEETPRAGFVGYLDTLRVSRVARYAGERFDPPHGKLPTDGDTLLLFNFTDLDGGTVADEAGHGRTGTLGVGFNGATSPDVGDCP